MSEITLERLNKEGFIFHRYDESMLTDNHEKNLQILKEYIQGLLSVPNENLYTDIDIVEQGMEIKPHYHIIPGSFQVVVWNPEGDFEGRYYLHGIGEELEKFKPFKGMMCFMKPNDPNFIHGVTPLISETPVLSYGFSSAVFPLADVNDIFV
jgi:hypothetical protein